MEYDNGQRHYQVDDTIQVTGRAKHMPATPWDGATVSYRVVREPRFVYPWLFSRWWTPPGLPGDLSTARQTGSDGQFIVSFKALPDRSIDPKLDPHIRLHGVCVDVTDINGETCSAEQRVSVFQITVAENRYRRVSADSLRAWAIRAENLSGHAEPATCG